MNITTELKFFICLNAIKKERLFAPFLSARFPNFPFTSFIVPYIKIIRYGTLLYKRAAIHSQCTAALSDFLFSLFKTAF